MTTISAVIITYNDAERIRPCLESIRWPDEIVIVDLTSTDSTVSICREFTDRIYRRDWLPYADPIRNEAIGLAHGTWVLMLDADERIAPALADALQTIAARDTADVVLIPYWYMSFGYHRVDPLAMSDALPRFFRKGAIRWPAEVHARPDLSGTRQMRLRPADGHYILHDSWRTTDEILGKIDRYTEQEAQLLLSRGVRFSVGRLLGETAREVGRSLMYQSYRNGTMGVMVTGMTVMYRWMVWVRLWELEGRPRAQDASVRRWGVALGVVPVLCRPIYRFLRTRIRATERSRP